MRRSLIKECEPSKDAGDKPCAITPPNLIWEMSINLSSPQFYRDASESYVRISRLTGALWVLALDMNVAGISAKLLRQIRPPSQELICSRHRNLDLLP